MLSWLSTCFIVSRATPTVINIDIPLNPSGMSQIAEAIDGRTATEAKKIEPGNVILLKICDRYVVVEVPGLTQGINPPCLLIMSDCRTGSNWIVV